MEKLGIIIGTALEEINTEKLNNLRIIQRHGNNHKYPPHLIPYKEHITTLVAQGIQKVIGICTVGTLIKKIKPFTFCIPDQIIDFTKNRVSTYSDINNVIHTPMWQPFNNNMRIYLHKLLNKLGYPYTFGKTYVAIEGARFSTKAESKMFVKLGGSIIGMTASPETFLAKEAGLQYALLCCVTDNNGYANYEEIKQNSRNFKQQIHNILIKLNEMNGVINASTSRS